jgi:hypothetical protein
VNPPARHIATERLVDFADGHLPESERADLEAHLSTCAPCKHKAGAFTHLIQVMHSDAEPDAPDYVVNRAVRLFRTERLAAATAAASGDKVSPRRRLLAILRMDSARQQFAFGQRAGRPVARALLFGIDDDNEVEVRIEAADGGWRVAGQILGNCSGGHVLLEGSAGQATAELNELCEFSLPPQPGAIYKLVLQLENADIEVPILELRS